AGNGINYGIIYLSRYRELRATGLSRDDALVQSALSSRKGTWLAAIAAGGAYGALLLTSFRGFSEFGLIGGVGMIFCWIATFTTLPALVTLVEEVSGGSASSFRPTIPLPLASVGRFVQRRRLVILGLFFILTAIAVIPLPNYLSDPWEYNFSKLGSSSSKKRGAGHWSRKANKLYQTRGSPMLILADDMSGTSDLRKRLREADKRITGGKYLERIETIDDRLGGPPAVVEDKLIRLAKIRKNIDKVLPRLRGEDLEIVKDWRPPEYLRPLAPEALPELVRAQFTAKDGTVGSPAYVHLNRGHSQSNGHNLLRIPVLLGS